MLSQEGERLADAERVAAFVLARTAEKAGPRSMQSRRRVRALDAQASLPASLELFATRHVLKVPEDAERGLFGFVRGTHRAVVLTHAPSPAELLAEEAKGARVVSLLPDGSDTGFHEDPLAFAIHDLCHLEKFQVDHEGQVGFFETMRRAEVLTFGGMGGALALDDTWRADTIAVTCDMNGSPIFLLAALKMRLKMAVRRVLARRSGGRENAGGPLSLVEEAAYAPILEALLDKCDLHGAPREAAREITARRQGMEHAHVFLAEMQARGRVALGRA